jgi:hypothetical protein
VEDPVSHDQINVLELESEVERLKLLVAELALDRRMLQEALKKSLIVTEFGGGRDVDIVRRDRL